MLIARSIVTCGDRHHWLPHIEENIPNGLTPLVPVIPPTVVPLLTMDP